MVGRLAQDGIVVGGEIGRGPVVPVPSQRHGSGGTDLEFIGKAAREAPLGREGQHRVGRDHGARRDLQIFGVERSEEHTSELQSLMRISYAVFCLKQKKSQAKIVYSV